MSKQKKEAKTYEHVTPEMVGRIEAVITEATVNHKHSVSRIYAAHNEAFQVKDKPQACSSCLTNRVKALQAFLKDFKASDEGENFEAGASSKAEGKTKAAPPASKFADKQGGEHATQAETDAANAAIDAQPVAQYTDAEGEGYVAPAEGSSRHFQADAEAMPIDFTPNEGSTDKGMAKHADGKTVKPGTYALADGGTVVVSVGSKATVKAPEGAEDLT